MIVFIVSVIKNYRYALIIIEENISTMNNKNNDLSKILINSISVDSVVVKEDHQLIRSFLFEITVQKIYPFLF